MRPADTPIIPIGSVVPTADYLMIHDVSGGVIGRVLWVDVMQSISQTQFNLTSNTALVRATHNFGHCTNVTAAGIITLTLWSPTVGDQVTFARGAYELRIAPASGQVLGEGTADQVIRMLAAHSGLTLKCYQTGIWTIIASGTLHEYA